MQRPKIYDLLDDPQYGVDAVDLDTGLVFTKQKDCALYAIIVFHDRTEAYLNICDEEEPFRNILGKGIGTTKEEAQKQAMIDLHRQAYASIN